MILGPERGVFANGGCHRQLQLPLYRRSTGGCGSHSSGQDQVHQLGPRDVKGGIEINPEEERNVHC
jgi:hypothetical protein